MTDFERVKQELINGGVVVDLDLVKPQGAGTFSVAQQLARQRADEISRGDGRVAYIYDKAKREKNLRCLHDEEIGVNEDECAELVKVGAKWIGPEFYAPPGHRPRC